jgi:hypothetical protein
VLNVWVAPTNDVSSAKAITHDSKRGIMQYQWAFDNAHILYLQDQGGNENWNIHSIDLEGQNDKNLTPNPKVAARIMQASDQFPTQILVGLNDRVPSFTRCASHRHRQRPGHACAGESRHDRGQSIAGSPPITAFASALPPPAHRMAAALRTSRPSPSMRLMRRRRSRMSRGRSSSRCRWKMQ